MEELTFHGELIKKSLLFIMTGYCEGTLHSIILQTEAHHTMDHTKKHLTKLTHNLLHFQKTGMYCDVSLHCKDGFITAHSGKIKNPLRSFATNRKI